MAEKIQIIVDGDSRKASDALDVIITKLGKLQTEFKGAQDAASNFDDEVSKADASSNIGKVGGAADKATRNMIALTSAVSNSTKSIKSNQGAVDGATSDYAQLSGSISRTDGELQDLFVGFGKATKAANSFDTVAKSDKASAINKMNGVVKRAIALFNKLRGSADISGGVNKSTDAIKKQEDRVKRLGDETNRAERSFNGLRNAAIGFISAAAIVQVTRQLIEATDTYKNLQSQLKLVTESQEEQNEVFEALHQLSAETRTSLDSSATLYARFTRSTGSLSLSQSQLLTITKAVNQSYIISGATSTEATNSIIQFTQGLQNGALRGEEFNSIMEQSPRLAKALADGLGIPIEQLRGQAEQGKLTTEIITRALLEQSAIIGSEFGELEKTIGSSATVARNSLLALFGELDTSGIISAIERVTAEVDNFRDSLVAGAFEARLTAIASKFDGFGLGLITSIDQVESEWDEFMSNMFDDSDEATALVSAAFSEMPQNIRAFVQLMTVELAAFIDKTGAFGQEILENIQFWEDETFNLEGRLKTIDSARDKSIERILAERNEGVAASKALEQAADDLSESFNRQKEAKEAARLAGLADPEAQTLATFELEGPEQLTEKEEVQFEREQARIERMEQMRVDAAARQLEQIESSLLTEEERIGQSFSRRAEFLQNNVEDEARRHELLLKLQDDFLKKMDKSQRKDMSVQSKLWQQGWSGRAQVLAGVLNSMTILMDSKNKEMFEIGKAAAISSTIIETYASAQKVFSSLSSIPFVGPALGAAAAAAAIIGGIARVNAISSTTIGSKSASASVGASGGGTPSVPQAPAAPIAPTSIDTEDRRQVPEVTVVINPGVTDTSVIRDLIDKLNEEHEDGYILNVG